MAVQHQAPKTVSLLDVDPDANGFDDPYPEARPMDQDRKAMVIMGQTHMHILHVSGPITGSGENREFWSCVVDAEDSAEGILEKLAIGAGNEGRDKTLRKVQEACNAGVRVGPVRLERVPTKQGTGFLRLTSIDDTE